MVTKQIAWDDGSGDHILLTYQGQENGSITAVSDVNNGDARSKTIVIETTAGSPVVTKNLTVNQYSCPVPVGTVLNYAYTGNVQSVLLPAGRYKLQCWGAQGGSVSGSYVANGAKGGYSEGILTLSEKTTVYIFVGGKGSDVSTNTTSGTSNGGWNGGGASINYLQTNFGGVLARCYPRSGGGATDIALVTSAMTYSNGRTNRSAASLNSRLIVAGGGAGASARYTESTSETLVGTYPLYRAYASGSLQAYCLDSDGLADAIDYGVEWGGTFKVVLNLSNTFSSVGFNQRTNKGSYSGSSVATYNCNSSGYVTIGAKAGTTNWLRFLAYASSSSITNATVSIYKVVTTTAAVSSDGTQVGGGTSGGGTNPGTQSGGGGEFGLGASQIATNYRYVSGAGGAGYYGGGRSYSDTQGNQINGSGGGSGYTGSLTSAQTKAGNTSFPSTSGGTEIGHSGNGYARITRLS